MAERENILVCIGLQNMDYGCNQDREIVQLQVSTTFTEIQMVVVVAVQNALSGLSNNSCEYFCHPKQTF